MGWAYTELSQFDKAKANLDRAIEIEPGYVTARKRRAVLFANESDWSDELSELEIICGIAPGDQWVRDAKEAALQKRQLPAVEQGQSVPQKSRPDIYPKVVSKSEPQYTDEARRALVSSTITCSLIINPNGVPQNIRVVRGAGFGLDENAIKAVNMWRFQPAMRQGVPIPYSANVQVNYRPMMPDHERQTTRLNFTMPSGGDRPELTRGKVPENPKDSADAELRIALTVAMDGSAEDVSVLETTSSEWAESAIREMKNWRFRPSAVNGQPQECCRPAKMSH
ncbi:MAG TPA: TonB family protein [Bryobacteraceae bacterium]|nr:TonB family protein [Bryobacteraceae bacterium]